MKSEEKVSSFLIVIDIDKNIGFKSLDKLSFQKDIERVLKARKLREERDSNQLYDNILTAILVRMEIPL